MARWLLRIGVVLAVAAVLIGQAPLPSRAVTSPVAYPVLPSNVQYYRTDFPVSLKYSSGWYGTFRNAPQNGLNVLLFDDNKGIAVFSLPNGVSPSGPQGGTVLTPLTQKAADTLIKSYSLDTTFKPIDSDIVEVMGTEDFYTGAWAGQKLEQKWAARQTLSPPSVLTTKQKNALDTFKLERESRLNADLLFYDPPRYAILPASTTSNWNSTGTWSASSGGGTGASVPTSADAVFVDALSVAGAGAILKSNVSTAFLSMDWTGVTNSPVWDFFTSPNTPYGNVILTSMTITGTTGYIAWLASGSLTTNSVVIPGAMAVAEAARTLTLLDDLTCTGSSLNAFLGTINTNGVTVNVNGLEATGTGVHGFILGASIITATYVAFNTGTTTINAGTSTIKVTGTGAFAGGGKTYYNVELNGTAHTISGSNTFSSLTLPSGTTQTITFTDGTTQAITTATLSGSAGKIHTLQGSGVAGWNISGTGGTFDYISVSRSAASVAGDWIGWYHSTDGGNNTGWVFYDNASIFSIAGVTVGAYVPYQDATMDVTLGAYTLSTTDGLISPKLYPPSDSTTALQITKADGLTNIIDVDTTNSRVGIGTASPSTTLQVTGDTTLAGDSWWLGAGTGIPYGSVYGNEIGWSQAVAVQNTWYNVSDTDMADGNGGLNLVTHDGDGKLTVTMAGRYIINYAITLASSLANEHIQAGIELNGTGSAISDGQQHWNSVANSDMPITGMAIVVLSASGTIEIAVRTTDAGTPDISVSHLNITITMVGG